MNDKVPCSSTKIQRGGTAYSPFPFELNLQLHGQVNNPYSFGIKQNYKSSAITKVSIPPYTEKSWTTPGTYTWTVPAGVTRIRVAVCGGGGGWIFAYGGEVQGENGGKSALGNLLSANGGGGAYVNHYTQTTAQETLRGGTGGTPNGRDGTKTFYQNTATSTGGNGFTLNFNMTTGNYGSGGSCTGSRYSASTVHAGGGSGGYNTKYVDVESLKTYQVIVGAGGAGKNSDNDNRLASYTNAKSGFVLIAYGEGIE